MKIIILTICALFIASVLSQNRQTQQQGSMSQTQQSSGSTNQQSSGSRNQQSSGSINQQSSGSTNHQSSGQLTQSQVQDASLRCFLNCLMNVDMNELEDAQYKCLFFDRTSNCFDQRISPIWMDFKQCLMPCLQNQTQQQGSIQQPQQGTGSLQQPQEQPVQGSTSAPVQGSTSAPVQGSTSAPVQGSTSAPVQGSTSAPQQQPVQGSASVISSTSGNA